MSREGAAKPITFNVVRGEIPLNSVDKAFWVKPGIAYMRIQSFTETTGKEVEENLKELGEQNIKGLILDLRENPGGLLQEGVSVAGHWLDHGQVVDTHRGARLNIPTSPTSPAAANMARIIRSSCW